MNARASNIITSTAKFYGLTIQQIIGRSRVAHIAFARMVCMAAMRRATKLGFEQIGIAIGNRDHSTVLQNIAALKSRSGTEREIEAHIAFVIADACDLSVPATGEKLNWNFADGDWFAASGKNEGQWLIRIEPDGHFKITFASYTKTGRVFGRRETLASSKSLAQAQEDLLSLPAKMERRSA